MTRFTTHAQAAARCLVPLAALVALLALAPGASAAPGLFEPRVDHSTATSSSAWRTVTADFDASGTYDVAIAHYGNGSGTGRITVSAANDDGTLGTATAYGPARTFLAIRTDDFNGDGFPDLVATSTYPAELHLLLNDGDGTFTASVLASNGDPEGLVTGDFDGDFNADIAFVTKNSGKAFRVLYGDGDGAFPDQRLIGSAQSSGELGVGDLDGDGADDVMTGTMSLDVFLSNGEIGTGRGFTQLAGDTRFDRPSRMSALGDINDDGNADVTATSNGGGALYAAIGNGDGTFAAPSVYWGTADADLELADVNGDGRDDLMVANNDLKVRLAQDGGTLGAPVTYATRNWTSDVEVGFVDADDYADVIIGYRDGAQIASLFLNQGASADLELDASDDVDPAINGTDVTYTFTAANSGPDTATDVVVEADVPDGADFVSASAGCDEDAGIVTCDVGDLPIRGQSSVEIVVSPTTAGTMTMPAFVEGTSNDPNPTNDDAEESTTVAPGADLSLNMTIGDGVGDEWRGSEVALSVLAWNAGPDAAEDVYATVYLPEGVEFVSSAFCTAVDRHVTCTDDDIPSTAGGAYALMIVRLTQLGSFSFDGTLTSVTKDPDTADRSITKTVTVTDVTDPTVELSTPTDYSTTPDATPHLSGVAGVATGDAATVTASIYAGHVVDPAALPAQPVAFKVTTRDDDGSWATSPADPLAPGDYTVRAEQVDDAGNTGFSGLHRFTVREPDAPVYVEETVPASGATVNQDAPAPTPEAPVRSQITVPPTTGGGTVTIAQQSEATAGESTPPAGFSFIGQLILIEADDVGTTAGNPLEITFTVDRSVLEANGVTAETIQVYRDGAVALRCVGGETATTADPDPCVKRRVTLDDPDPDINGDAEITILTAHASEWNFGKANPTPAETDDGGSDGGDQGSDSQPPAVNAPVPTAAPAPAPAPPSGAVDGAVDAPPLARLTVPARFRRATLLKKGFTLNVACGEPCSATAKIKLDRKTAKKLKLKGVVGTARGASNATGSAALKVKIAKKALTKLRKAKRFKLKLTVITVDAGGRRTTATKTISVV